MNRRPFVAASAAWLLTFATLAGTALAADKDRIITEIIVEAGKPAAVAAATEPALLPPVTLVVYDSLGLSGMKRYMQIRQMLRDAYRLETLGKVGSDMLELAVGQAKAAPSPFPGLDVSFTLLDVDDLKATYEIKLVEAGKDPVATKVKVKRSDWGIVGGRDGAEAPYFFVMFRPLSQAEEQEEHRWDGMTRPKLLKSVKPQYPEEARKAKVQDVIVLDCKIRTDGTVASATAVQGEVPELIEAARQAALQWVFEPARLASGEPVEVMFKVTLAFRLE
jgi:TonB family protein